MRFVKRTCAAFTGIAAVTAAAAGTPATAVERDEQERLGRDRPVALNDSFVSPLTEVLGDVRVGRHVFVASNSIVRADARRRVCLGEETNV